MVAKKSNWIELSSPVRSESEQGIYSASFYMKDLAARGAINAADWKNFRAETNLDNFYWRAYWRRGDIIAAGGRADFPRNVSAVVVLMHGWDGCADIWENLPARLSAAETNVLVLVPDVNGFSRSPFSKSVSLGYEMCNPAANMKAVELWLQTLGILGGRRHTPIVFVGHSMSGAALFYLKANRWSNHKIGRVALSPALLMNDMLRKGFFRTLGIGIWATHQLQIEQLSDSLSPVMVNTLITGASKSVQSTHRRVFKATDKRTLATTFFAMGRAELPNSKSNWEDFKVLLGHEDRLVGMSPMLALLTELGFGSRNVRVILGDHYFFSVGRHSHKLHQESREVTLEEIIQMVAKCRR